MGALYNRQLKEIAFLEQRFDMKFCGCLGKSATETYEMLNYSTTVIFHHKRKVLSDIVISEEARKMSKTTKALAVRRLPALPRTLKRFLRLYAVTSSKQ